MDPITLFGTIYESYCTIFANFYIHLQYFQQKIFNFSKIDPKCDFRLYLMNVVWFNSSTRQ